MSYAKYCHDHWIDIWIKRKPNLYQTSILMEKLLMKGVIVTVSSLLTPVLYPSMSPDTGRTTYGYHAIPHVTENTSGW